MKRFRTQSTPAERRHSVLSAEFPGPDGRPLCSVRVELETSPQGAGEQLRLRAHLHTSFGNVAALGHSAEHQSNVLPAPAHGGPPVRRAAASLVRRGLSSALATRLASPLLRHDIHTWIDINASTASLLGGASALMSGIPDSLRRIGVQLPSGDGPLAQTWAGEAGGRQRSFAQFSLLRLDKRHLPPALRALLGARPFQMMATFANVIEEHVEPEPHSCPTRTGTIA